MQGTGNKLEALIQWLDTDPHLHGGEIVDRASLLQICLGLGILLGDAHLIHFTEGELSDEVPGYIAASPWNATQYDKFQNYICKVRHDLEKDIADSRYVELLVIRCTLLLILVSWQPNEAEGQHW